MASDTLSADEVVALVGTVFAPRPEDRRVAVLTDLPDGRQPDRPDWRERRELAAQWAADLDRGAARLGLQGADLYLYRHVGTNNGELPAEAWRHDGGPLPDDADTLATTGAATTPFAELFAG